MIFFFKSMPLQVLEIDRKQECWDVLHASPPVRWKPPESLRFICCMEFFELFWWWKIMFYVELYSGDFVPPTIQLSGIFLDHGHFFFVFM